MGVRALRFACAGLPLLVGFGCRLSGLPRLVVPRAAAGDASRVLGCLSGGRSAFCRVDGVGTRCPGHRSCETRLRELLGYMGVSASVSGTGGAERHTRRLSTRWRRRKRHSWGGVPRRKVRDLNVDRLLLSYPLPIAFPSVTAWIARATVATLPAFSPAMEMRPSFVR